MSRHDIMPFRSALGGHTQLATGVIDATEDYEEGDVVVLNGTDIEEAADEPAVETVWIATQPSQGVANYTTAAGTIAAANTAGITVGMYPFVQHDEYITENFASDDDTSFTDTPDEDDVGTVASLRTDGTLWGVCNHASSSNLDFVITRVLDVEGRDVSRSGETGTQVVFRRSFSA